MVRERKEKYVWKLAFWNVAGLQNKDREFWKRIEKWDIVICMEKRVDRKKWAKIKDRLPKSYK